MWCILLYLRAIFVATPTGEVSEVEIFLRFDGVPEPALSSIFAPTCSQQSVFFRVHPLSVCGLTFTCMRGSVIFSNLLDFAVYVWTTCVACPLAAFSSSISPCYNTVMLYVCSMYYYGKLHSSLHYVQNCFMYVVFIFYYTMVNCIFPSVSMQLHRLYLYRVSSSRHSHWSCQQEHTLSFPTSWVCWVSIG